MQLSLFQDKLRKNLRRGESIFFLGSEHFLRKMFLTNKKIEQTELAVANCLPTEMSYGINAINS